VSIHTLSRPICCCLMCLTLYGYEYHSPFFFFRARQLLARMHLSLRLIVQTILPCNWWIRYRSNSFTNFLGLPVCFMFEVLIYSVVQQLSWEFQRELHCFYWIRKLIAICSTVWNILHHTVLPHCRELMVPQSCPPPTALALRWSSGHARCQCYVLLL
jgi:hypothetical protein